MAENTKHYTEHDRELSNTNPTKTRRCTQMSSKLIHITQLLRYVMIIVFLDVKLKNIDEFSGKSNPLISYVYIYSVNKHKFITKIWSQLNSFRLFFRHISASTSNIILLDTKFDIYVFIGMYLWLTICQFKVLIKKNVDAIIFTRYAKIQNILT